METYARIDRGVLYRLAAVADPGICIRGRPLPFPPLPLLSPLPLPPLYLFLPLSSPPLRSRAPFKPARDVGSAVSSPRDVFWGYSDTPVTSLAYFPELSTKMVNTFATGWMMA